MSPRQRSVQKSGTCAQLRPVKNRADAAKAAAATSPRVKIALQHRAQATTAAKAGCQAQKTRGCTCMQTEALPSSRHSAKRQQPCAPLLLCLRGCGPLQQMLVGNAHAPQRAHGRIQQAYGFERHHRQAEKRRAQPLAGWVEQLARMRKQQPCGKRDRLAARSPANQQQHPPQAPGCGAGYP